MLSQFISSRQALLNTASSSLFLSHISQPLSIDLLPLACKQIRVLTLNHCGLRTLQGIEQFDSLEELNIKYNDIRETEELYRIKNKEKIKKLDFSGNDIEYFGSGLFINLKPIFPQLVELNGKDFSQIIGKRKMEKHSMNKILKRAHKLERQLANTIKSHKTKQTAIKQAYQEAQPASHSKQAKTTKRRQAKNRYEESDLSASERQMEVYEEEQYQSSTDQKSSRYEGSECALKQNKNFNNFDPQNTLNDVSLGGISYIPMTKSVRGSMVSTTGVLNRRKGLEIFTLNESLQAKNAALSQPTATFAMQRQKETENPQNFAFRNKSKKYSNYQIPLQEYKDTGNYQQERPTKRQTFGSSYGSDDEDEYERYYLQESDEEGNIMTASIWQNNNRVIQMAERWYEMQLQWKIFKLLKYIPRKRNLPMKLNFQ